MLPTEKQLKIIRNIETVLEIKFDGKTKREAWLWMQKHIPTFHHVVLRADSITIERSSKT